MSGGEKRWAIPERLAHIPDAEDPNFFNMVEYYYHKACVIAEDKLVSFKEGIFVQLRLSMFSVHCSILPISISR